MSQHFATLRIETCATNNNVRPRSYSLARQNSNVTDFICIFIVMQNLFIRMLHLYTSPLLYSPVILFFGQFHVILESMLYFLVPISYVFFFMNAQMCIDLILFHLERQTTNPHRFVYNQYFCIGFNSCSLL